ncbi:MAG TPA: hypothetical protein VES42_10275 [Pilimelia sp.]|nr:hypothetical protein [Pilimelia sp.]
MGWTADDGEALFRQPPDGQAGDDHAVVLNDSAEAMRRLRSPFDAEPADGREQPHTAPTENG